MLNAIAIDDEPLSLDLIQNFCSQTDFISLDRTFTKSTDAEKYLINYSVDLIFLDIQMPQISGIEFCKMLNSDVMVIFTTAYGQYALDGFNLNAIDYLLKPFSFDRFLVAVNKANAYFKYQLNNQESELQNLYVRSDYILHKIPFSDILYIESFGDNLNFNLVDGKILTARMSLKSVIEKLPRNDFMRVHRSYIVRLSKIDKIYKKNISISNVNVPIGTNYETDFFMRLNSLL